jgi:hypothetical protein
VARRAARRLGRSLALLGRSARAALALIAGAAVSLAQTSDDRALEEIAAAVGLERPAEGWTWAEVERVEYELLQRLDVALPGEWSRGKAFARLRRFLVELGAPARSVGLAVTLAEVELIQENERAAARAELEFGVASLDETNPYLRGLWIDLAALEVADERWDAAHVALERGRASLSGPAVERLEAEDPDPAPVGDEERLLALDLARWHGTRAELELVLGRPDLAHAFVAAEERISDRVDDDNLAWSALDHRLRLDLATMDFAGARRRIALERAKPGYASLAPSSRRKLEVREGLALHELELRGRAEPGRAIEILEGAASSGETGAQDVLDARVTLARAHAERGRRDDAARQIALARAGLGDGGRRDPRAVQLDALEAVLAFEDGGEADRRAALERLEASFGGLVDAWSKAPAGRTGLGFLHFVDRYVVLDALVRGCVAVEGPAAGARRALGWIHDAQRRVGGLARALGAEGIPLEDALAPITADGRGAVVLVPGRTRSHVLLVDSAGTELFEAAANWKLLEAHAELVSDLERAVRRGEEIAAPTATLLDAVAEEMLPSRARARIASWSGATVVADELHGHWPLEILPLDGGRRLGDAVALQYAPSLAVAAALARRAASRAPRDAASVRVRIVGAPSVTETDAALWPADPIEAGADRWRRWSELYELPAELRLGEAATRDAFASAAADGVDALQIVAHGIEDPRRLPRGGILLAGTAGATGATWAEDVEAGSAPRLCLLAVCRAARSMVRTGDDGRAALAASFALAGADCVVLTTSDLEVEAALDLFERIHARLADGEDVPGALRGARAELAAAGDARLQHGLVHVWGWGFEPLVRRAPGAEARAAPADEPGSPRWRTYAAIGAGAAAAAVAALAVARRRR